LGKKVKCMASLALLAFVLSGCEIPGQEMDISTRLAAPGSGFIDAIGLDEGDEQEREPSYVLGVNDIVDLRIVGHPEHSGTMLVDYRGELEVPELDVVVKVDGLEIDAAERAIQEAVAPYLVGPPPVRLRVRQVNSKFFYALGAIGIPGRHRLGMSPLYLRDAVIRAGLFQEYRSAANRVVVIRPDKVKPTFVVVNVARILKGDLKENFKIRNGDVIYVPDTLLYKWEQFVDIMVRQIETIQTVDQAVRFIEVAEDRIRNAPFEDKRGRAIVIYR